MTYNELINAYDIDEKYLHCALGIPARTLRAWKMEERKAPDYVIRLLGYFIANEIREGRL